MPCRRVVINTRRHRSRALGEQALGKRATAFAPWGTHVVDHFNTENSNNVPVSVDVFDLAAMKKAIASPEIELAKQAHGCSSRCRSTSEQLIPLRARR